MDTNEHRHTSIIHSAVDHLQNILPGGTWAREVVAFLKRPAATGFLAAVMEETGKGAQEAVLVLLAALRYLDLDEARPGEPTVLEEGHEGYTLELTLVRHHGELYQLCLRKRVQANLPARALVIMEHLGLRFPGLDLAVLELGASYGLLGRVMLQGGKILGQAEHWFSPGQQMPVAIPRIGSYLGLDLGAPDLRWLLASLPDAETRQRIGNLLRVSGQGPQAPVVEGDALDFLDHPQVRVFLAEAGSRIPVVLTSFFLYQLPPETRGILIERIRAWCRSTGGHWASLDVVQEAGALAFHLRIDGDLEAVLDDDTGRSWRAPDPAGTS